MPQKKNILQDEKQNIYLEVIYIIIEFVVLDLKSNSFQPIFLFST
jgi:hypothetical protein